MLYYIVILLSFYLINLPISLLLLNIYLFSKNYNKYYIISFINIINWLLFGFIHFIIAVCSTLLFIIIIHYELIIEKYNLIKNIVNMMNEMKSTINYEEDNVKLLLYIITSIENIKIYIIDIMHLLLLFMNLIINNLVNYLYINTIEYYINQLVEHILLNITVIGTEIYKYELIKYYVDEFNKYKNAYESMNMMNNKKLTNQEIDINKMMNNMFNGDNIMHMFNDKSIINNLNNMMKNMNMNVFKNMPDSSIEKKKKKIK